MLSWPRCVWGSEQRFFTIPAFLVTTLRQGSDVRRRPHAQTISCPLQGQGCLPPQTRGDPDLLRITLAAAMKILRPIHRLPRSPSHPCPEPHERAQPLQFEARNARNARSNAITGIDTAAVDPAGGVPEPAPFPIAKTAENGFSFAGTATACSSMATYARRRAMGKSPPSPSSRFAVRVSSSVHPRSAEHLHAPQRPLDLIDS